MLHLQKRVKHFSLRIQRKEKEQAALLLSFPTCIYAVYALSKFSTLIGLEK